MARLDDRCLDVKSAREEWSSRADLANYLNLFVFSVPALFFSVPALYREQGSEISRFEA